MSTYAAGGASAHPTEVVSQDATVGMDSAACDSKDGSVSNA